MADTLPLSIQPVIGYPKEAEVGKTYLMEIDLQMPESGFEWQYEEEEYLIYCMVNAGNLFTVTSVGEPAIVLHRFGGTYGNARFLLEADIEEKSGSLTVVFANQWGTPIRSVSSEVSIQNVTGKSLITTSQKISQRNTTVDNFSSGFLYIELHPKSATKVELRYQIPSRSYYEKQILQTSEIDDLIELVERNTPLSIPDPVEIGKKLFAWLDGDERWLSRTLDACKGELLVLAIANLAKLPHLPWEVLHDREGFLIDRTFPKVVPVRWTKGEVVANEPADRPLRVMFMATDPEGVEPRLNFEGEEGRILDATRGAALTLRVEESGCVSELKKTWRRYGDNHFDVFHLTGHASIADDGQPFFITETETGDRYDAKAGEIVDALRFRLPRLVFLSGCRTGQAGEQGATPSMAEALLNLGLTAVLGWGRPIGDDVATLAAACFYESLASGSNLVEAIAATYQKLREKNMAHQGII